MHAWRLRLRDPSLTIIDLFIVPNTMIDLFFVEEKNRELGREGDGEERNRRIRNRTTRREKYSIFDRFPRVERVIFSNKTRRLAIIDLLESFLKIFFINFSQRSLLKSIYFCLWWAKIFFFLILTYIKIVVGQLLNI